MWRTIRQDRLARTWVSQALVEGETCAWLAPQHMTWSEVYVDLTRRLRPIVDASSKSSAVIRLRTGGRIDFWSLRIRLRDAAVATIASSLTRQLSRRTATRRPMAREWIYGREASSPLCMTMWCRSRARFSRCGCGHSLDIDLDGHAGNAHLFYTPRRSLTRIEQRQVHSVGD